MCYEPNCCLWEDMHGSGKVLGMCVCVCVCVRAPVTISDEQAMLKKENVKLKANIASLDRENEEYAGVLSGPFLLPFLALWCLAKVLLRSASLLPVQRRTCV